MNRQLPLLSSLLALALAVPATHAQQSPHTFAVSGDHFTLDGKPFQVISGAIHYERIPRAYWRDRLKKARAMGLNTVETYAFWNAHESIPGHFDFTGQNDIAEFIREAQQEGLYVILRPGPYDCAEWEWGGFPAWLNSDPKMVVRSSYPSFLTAANRFIRELGKQTAPLQIGNGGPIIAVQVENEYGSYGDDHAYMEQIHKAVLDAGYTKSLLYTADGADRLAQGSLPELPIGVNFGTGDAERSFGLYDKFRPGSIHFNSEYWDGWFDHWGAKHETRDAEKQVAELRSMLSHGDSVNLYMFDGGTSFGWMNGANSNGANADGTTSKNANYEPDVTSYDYDVPVAETGELRPKYFAFRKVIQEVTHATLPEPPAPLPPPVAIGPLALEQSASLWRNLPQPVHSNAPRTMEDLGQSYGYILYRTTLGASATSKAEGATLRLPIVHDYAMVYLDGVFQGAIDRRLNQSTLTIHPKTAAAKLDILVENTGRVNYGKGLPNERAGLLATPTLDGATLESWDNQPLPMLSPETLAFTKAPCTGPCFYRADFTVDKPADTYLDTSTLGKGMVWINGIPLGRFWMVGPQQTLYLPGAWLHPGSNNLVIFDLDGKPGRSVQGLTTHHIDAPVQLDPLSSSAH
ncbi:beta-galactosidase family protein [Acidipila sp. EB88]|uniref:glycoside hydrolase family 35 protein n=1 Tax=Acidipila sp. EB88 TaxID=2305226 RepID=UPI000F5FD7E2|nr:beta-galactosidase family protein [Acidipila sp. EB88]RRA47261.1 beta-galactosidase [Acidipila sp. EB88]